MPVAEERNGGPRSFWNFIGWTSVLSLALFGSTYFDWGEGRNLLHEPVRGLAEAGLIAMLLAATVDVYFKAALVQDAFKASIGYILPEYLQEEMAAIYSNELVCIDHNQVVTLSELRDGLVQVRVRVERTLKNISTVTHLFNPRVDVDEWLVENHPSRIREVGYKKGDEPDVQASLDRIEPVDGQTPRFTVQLPRVEISPGEIVEFWYESDEIRHHNDMHMVQFRYSTNRPRVRVEAPLQIGWIVEFGHRQTARTSGKTVVLSSLLLPSQCIVVRWWDRTREKAWRAVHSLKT